MDKKEKEKEKEQQKNEKLSRELWPVIFLSPELRAHKISIGSVVEVFYTAEADHMPAEGFCRSHCTLGYLGLFQLDDGRYVAIQTRCDLSRTAKNIVMFGPSRDGLMNRAFSDEDRLRLRMPFDETE